MSEQSSTLVDTTKKYYDSSEADNFYFHIWGGEDIHVGIYDREGIPIKEASEKTVVSMADMLGDIRADQEILDLGAGYGGAARYLTRRFGCKVVCLNLSTTQNERNRQFNAEQQLQDRIEVVDGNFESLPFTDGRFDVVWSEDSFLHTNERESVLREAWRVLKSGGQLLFTDPMQKDQSTADHEAMQPILNRIHLDSLGSIPFYREAAQRIGFREIEVKEMGQYLTAHYSSVLAEINRRYDELVNVSSEEYLTRMKAGLEHWINGGKNGLLTWGILHFQKP